MKPKQQISLKGVINQVKAV